MDVSTSALRSRPPNDVAEDSLSRSPESRVRAAWPFLALAGLTLLAYGRALFFGFSHDDMYLLHPVSQWRFLQPSMIVSDFWRPLWELVLSIEYERFGLWAQPMHLVNLVVQYLDATLIFVLLRRLRAGDGVALATAAVWSLLATTATGAVWISGLDDPMALTGLLIATYLWVRGPTDRGPSMSDALLATLCWFLAMLAKEVGVAWPFAMIALTWWRRRGRVGARGAAFDATMLLPIVAFAVYMGLRLVALRHPGAVPAVDTSGTNIHGSPIVVIAGRLIHYGEALVYNVIPLDFFRTWPGITTGIVIGAALVITFAITWMREPPQHGGRLALGAGWVLLFSVHGLVSPAPRTLYVPAIGLAFVLCEWVAASAPFRRSVAAGLVVAAYLGMNILLSNEVMDVQDSRSFGNRVRDSQLLLSEDPRITPDKKAYLATQLQFERADVLAKFTREEELALPWRVFVQGLFKRVSK